jgi:hypothetical protein
VTPLELATARSRTWGLLGQLLLRGPTEGILAAVQAVPSLGVHLVGVSADDLQAAHHAVLDRAVPPHASLFVGEGLLGGASAEAARAALDEIGFRGTVGSVEPDHAGLLCLGMAHLCEAEADALQDGHGGEAVRVVAVQERFLRGQLLGWAPPLIAALQAEGVPLYAELGGLLGELIASHGVGLEDAEEALVDPLADPSTGLADLGEWLITPLGAGWWLSQGTLERWGRALDVPLGFGPRKRVAAVILRGVAGHGRLAELAGLLRAEVGEWKARYEALALLGLPVSRWVRRLDLVLTVAGRLEEAGERDVG